MKLINAPAISTRHGIAAACVSVVLLWLAFPGGGEFWPLLPVACVPFLVSICRGTRRQVFLFSLFFGTVHFLVQLYWLVFVVGHYGGLPLYLSIPTLFLLCLYVAGYLVVFACIARCLLQRFTPSVCLWLLPSVWVATDYLRSFVLSGFPWMDLGYGFATAPLLMQVSDIFGHYGLTYLIILLNTLFAFCLLARGTKQIRKAMVIPVCVLIICTLSYSAWRWQSLDAQLTDAAVLKVGVVQGNIDQGQKWDPAGQGVTVAKYLAQSSTLVQGVVRPDLLLWPETALPFYPLRHPLLVPISRFLQEEEVMLLAGAPWYDLQGTTADTIRLYNASLLFDANGEIINRTAKSHLVPFGEYVPFKRFLPFIAPLVESVGNFIPGTIENPPVCQNARIGVLICFESIFPDISRKWVDAGANILVNITNDAWYGRTSAPHQTLAMTRIRAVETRRSVVRSANTGFSVFIDPLGRVGEQSPLFESWQSVKSAALMEERTFFVRGGFSFAPVCLMVALIAFVVCLRNKD